MQTATAEKKNSFGTSRQVRSNLSGLMLEQETQNLQQRQQSQSQAKSTCRKALKLCWTFTSVMSHTLPALNMYNVSCYCLENPKQSEPATPRSPFHLHFCQLRSLLNAITNDLACGAIQGFSCLIQATAVRCGCPPSVESCTTKLAKYCSN